MKWDVFLFFFLPSFQVKKRQQRVLMILDSKKITYDVVDISEPGKEAEKEFMQEKSTNKGATISDQEPRHALPPQIFADDEYCGKWICIEIQMSFWLLLIFSLCQWIDTKNDKNLFIITLQTHAHTPTGSYDEFDLANETDSLEQFLKLAPPVEENNGNKEVSNDN